MDRLAIEGAIMTRRPGRTAQRQCVVWFTVLALLTCKPAFADPIFKGTGATAWVNALDQSNQQTGSTPASLSTSANVSYTHFSTLAPDQAPVSVTVSASSTPTAGAAYLLDIRSLATSPVSYDVVGASHPGPLVQATANWGNVAATVQGPPGSTLPGSIRLEFQVDYTSPGQAVGEFGAASGHFVDVNPGPAILLGPVGTPIEAGEQPVHQLADGMLSGTFHLDLPLSGAGVSKQFSVSISSSYWALPLDPALGKGDQVGLALKSVTLPDGTPLEQKGYSVTFDSGLPDPVPVPEPAAWAVWGSIIVVGSIAVRLRPS
jgi:hypothetical protein